MSFRFHVLGLPHTAIHPSYVHCAYSMKLRKWGQMVVPRGHEVIYYSNEGADVESFGCENVQMLTEAERASFFGGHDRQKLYDLLWDSSQPYWKLLHSRAIPALRQRVKKGDFILSAAGCVDQPVANMFPGSYSGTPVDAMWVEAFIGYYGTFSRYRVFESETHREWMAGRADLRVEDNDSAAIANYWDLADFVVPSGSISPKWQEFQAWLRGRPYYAFVGRVINEKGIHIADQVAADLGVPLVVAGQGNWQVPPEDADMVFKFGAANVAERAAIMTNAVAGLNPTSFREPFGGTAVEFQLCGTPALTTDHGAFTQTCAREWRCASHREFVEAARRAQALTPWDRREIKESAESRFSLPVIAELYERYFERLKARFWGGWYEMRDTTDLEIP